MRFGEQLEPRMSMQEQENREPSKTEKILAMLDELPFAQAGKAGDLKCWNETMQAVSQYDINNLDEFIRVMRVELNEEKEFGTWSTQEQPEIIMRHVKQIVELIKAWQEKE